MRYDVGIGDFKVSSNISDEIKTYALGSCVAVIVYEKVAKVAGMVHVALPESKINEEKGRLKPGYFADTGVPALIAAMEKKGAKRRQIIVKLAGGASVMDDNGRFDIGRRNTIAIKRELWKLGLGVIKEDVGGKISRTVSILVETGETKLSNSERKWTL